VNVLQWKVGDRCRARFTEDQCLYEAEILSVDESAGTCYVRYADYGNEEEQMIKDLVRVQTNKHKPTQESENEVQWENKPVVLKGHLLTLCSSFCCQDELN
jgi:survival motor neuron protein